MDSSVGMDWDPAGHIDKNKAAAVVQKVVADLAVIKICNLKKKIFRKFSATLTFGYMISR